MTLYRVATKAHRITFPLASLEPVQSGSKCATIRFSAVTRRVHCGDAVALYFGAYHKPTVVQATAVRLEHLDLDLEADIETAYTLDDTVMSLVAERRFYERTLEPTAAAVLKVLTANGGDYTALISAAAHDPDTCTAVWWTLAE